MIARNVKDRFISINTKADLHIVHYLSLKYSLQNASNHLSKKSSQLCTTKVSREKSDHDQDNLGMTSLNSFSKFLQGLFFIIITHIILIWFLLLGHLDSVSDEAKKGSNPQQHGKATKQLFTELHPLRGSGWWCQSIRTITHMQFISLFLCMTLQM